MSLKILELTDRDRSKWEESIAGLERGVLYPLGDDFFEIDHGSNYFAFFDRMGKSSTYIAKMQSELAAVGSLILRKIPSQHGKPAENCWYLCDLKVARGFRRQRIPLRIFTKGFPKKYPICPRGYAVSMNPGDGSENPVVRLASHIGLVPVRTGPILLFYSLNHREFQRTRAAIEFHRGPVGFRSMRGVKDIVLKSTDQPMDILHLQFGPCADSNKNEPEEDSVHMFCTPAGDALAEEMLEAGIHAHATASILHHRMQDWDWRFILTNEI